jgi:predicted PolB exonuclease-like 3'-5' exonuclease
MDLLANFSPKAYAPLDKIAKMLNLPGKMGVSGANVKNLYLENRINDIRNYCETDVINTFFVWLKFEKMRGNFSERNYTDAYDKCLAFLENNKAPHLQEYLDELNSLKPDNLL